MKLAFAFLLTVYTPDGMANVYVMDSGLTGAECIAAVETYMQESPDMSHGLPSCEVDFGH